MSNDHDPPPRAPDLQAFIAKHGGLYSAIPPSAWAQWDRQNEQWHEARRQYYESLKRTR
jgi:hypothetical protein